MRILVTGAAGFLARPLLELLRKENHELHGVDFRPVQAAVSHQCDLGNAAEVAALIRAVQPDRVFHLAGTFTNEFAADFTGNVTTTQHLLEAVCTSAPAARVVLIGSAAEYGCVRPEENPVPEDHPLAPVSLYGWSKVCQTHLAGFYHRVRGADVVLARLFNLSGKGASPRLFVGRLNEQIARFNRGETQEILVGNLNSVRDYVSTDEAARQLAGIANHGQAGKVYHVGSGVPVKMRDLLERMLAEAGIGLESVRVAVGEPAGKLDIPMIFADMQRTKALLQTEP